MVNEIDKKIAVERLFELAEKVRQEAELPRGIIPIVILLDPKADCAAWGSRVTDPFLAKVLKAVVGEIERHTITIAAPIRRVM